MKSSKILFYISLTCLIFSVSSLSAFTEVSGITWIESLNCFFSVGDEGDVYELDAELSIKRSRWIGSYDLEAITYNSLSNTLFCLNEKNLSLIELDLYNLSIINIFPLVLPKEKGRNFYQFESLVFVDGLFYLAASVEEKDEEFGTLFTVIPDNPELVPVGDIPLLDISGLTSLDDYLIMISDKENIIARYSLSSTTFDSRSLDGDHQEGVCIAADKKIIVFDENGEYQSLYADIFND